MKKIIVLLAILSSFCFSQKLSDDPQQVKDALLESTLIQQKQSEQIEQLMTTLSRIADDLKKIETKAQLDSLKQVYKLDK